MQQMSDLQPQNQIANRYRVLGVLGTGGMACVYEVADAERKTTLALKRLLPEVARDRRAILLFRREYTALTQLAHPFIVRAYDYGVDGELPYYTMELLSGDDLRSLAPLPWRPACSLLRDVASALAIIHSRRLLHRDVTARNVRRTAEGSAKLLDFGALCPMGFSQEVAGTPPFVSPESLNGQPLDARSDLFSLGALAHFLLIGRHAYPAARLSDLNRTWTRRLEPPSNAVADLPENLSALVMSLLSLNPLARPASAAEVSERLTAIAGLPPADVPEIAQAYLSSPALVGREDALARFRRRVLRAERRRGSALLIEGDHGSGRSRMLTSLLTEARQSGFVALYARGEAGREGPFSVARALANRLVENRPELKDTVKDPTLLSFLNQDAGSERGPIDPDAWPEIVSALADWFIALSTAGPLAIAVDNLEECDAPSLAVLAKLTDPAPSQRLLVVSTALVGSAHAAVRRFKRMGGSLVLKPFRLAETKELVCSIFGDVPHTEAVAEWVQRLSQGNLRTELELLQHLADRGAARYEQGSWVLPVSAAGLNLPHSLDQALDAKLSSLAAPALELAECLSLTARNEPLLLEDYLALMPGQIEQTVIALGELVAAGVLVLQDAAYEFADQSIRQAIVRRIAAERTAELHRRLAGAYAASMDPENALSAYHHHLAGDSAKAFSALVGVLGERRSHHTRRGYRLVRSPEGARFVERMFEWGTENGAAPTDLVLVGRCVLQLASVIDSSLARHAPLILKQLERDSGLVYWDEFESIADPLERIRTCVARALTLHDATPERARGLPPIRAIQTFAVCTAMLAGVHARASDPEAAAALLEPINRLRPLSPAVQVVANVIAYTVSARRGWSASELRTGVLEQIAEPVPGIDEISRAGIRMLTHYFQALEEAVLGEATLFERLKILESRAPYAPLAWQVRAIAHLFQGAEKQAELCRKQRDLALVGRFDVDQQLETSVALESTAYVILGDLMALKRILPVLENLADKWPGWRAQHLLVQGAYHGVRGELEKALALSEQALALLPAAGHASWALAVVRVVRLSVQLGRATQARAIAAAALAESEKHPILPPYVDQLEMALALAEARSGDAVAGTRRAQRVVARAEQHATAGILLIELYAVQAQIAEIVNDLPTFEGVSQKISLLCTKVESAAFATKLSVLLNLPLGAGFEPVDVSARTLVKRRAASALVDNKVRTELELCQSAEERAKRALGLVLEHSRIKQGFLYLNQAQGPVLAASRCDSPPPIETEEHILKWIGDFRSPGDDCTTATTSDFGDRFAFVGLTSDRDGQAVLAA
ncbi:MAG TPA: protein kinase, partial [Polyangiaceae bacterium]|nr:protein kinase [Polyangiaceae bacterium]